MLPTTSNDSRLLSADLNGDGRPDLVAYGARYTGPVPVNVFLNNGSGGFLAPSALPGSTGMLVQIGDMNGDGYPDIVGCKNVGSGQSATVSVTVYLNNKTGGFTAQPAVTGAGNTECNALVLGDVFQNGHLDVVTAGYTPGQYNAGGTFYPGNTNTIQVFGNNGTGALALKEAYSPSLDDSSNSTFTNCGAVDLVGADFLQNGKFSLIVTTNCQPKGQNLPGNVGTTFLVTETTDQYGNEGYSTATHVQSAYETYVDGKVYDVNGDGKPDVLFSADAGGNYGADLVYMQNDGNGSFTFSKLLNNSQNTVYGSTVADFNGDGYNDIATEYNQQSFTTQPPMMTILAGSKAGTFSTSQTFLTGTGNDNGGDVVAADFNGDGKPDIATLKYDRVTKTTSLVVYTNTQAGSSNACSAPSTANTNTICSPTNGASLNSPVTVNAASNVTGFTDNRLYLDNKDVYDTTTQTLSIPLNVANGTHTLVLVSYNNQGQAFTSTRTFTVGTATGSGCIPSSAGVSICSPAANSTDNSPVTVTAGARAQSGTITAIRVYIDNNAVYFRNNSGGGATYQISQQLGVSAGTHHMVVVGYESTGAAVTNSLTFTVPGGACTPDTTGDSMRLCSPSSVGTDSSPVNVNAGAHTMSGYIATMRVYVDNKPVAIYNNPQRSATYVVNQSLTIPSGRHYFVVVAYPSTGGSISAAEYITIQ